MRVSVGDTMKDAPREDVSGRIESFDQSVRSLEKRLRAVERRLCVEVSCEDVHGTVFEEPVSQIPEGSAETLEKVPLMRKEIDDLKDMMENSIRKDISNLQERLEDILSLQEKKLSHIQERDRITIGSMRIPVEISGILGSVLLLMTGVLIYAGRWDVIRDPYFSLSLGLLLASVVIIKFYIVNRDR